MTQNTSKTTFIFHTRNKNKLNIEADKQKNTRTVIAMFFMVQKMVIKSIRMNSE
jgi:hypothetical protein